MQDNVGNQGQVRTYGPQRTHCFAHFTGAIATSLTLTDSFGIASVTQSSTTSGLFTVTLSEKFAAFHPTVIATGDTTLVHEATITAISTTAGTFTFSHYVSATRGAATAPNTLSNGASPAVTFYIHVVGRGAM